MLAAIAATVIAAVGGAACSNNTSGTWTSSTTGTPSSTAAPPATSTTNASRGASPSTSSSAAPSATASAHFVGHWHVHDAQMDITPTTATMTVGGGIGPCTQNPQLACSETDTLAVVSGNDKKLTLKVTAVSYNLGNGQTTSVNPETGPSTAVGDVIRLAWQAPGLLKQTVLHGFPGSQGGNPYWCGDGISQSDKEKCGA